MEDTKTVIRILLGILSFVWDLCKAVAEPLLSRQQILTFLEKNGCSGVWTINSFLIWWSLSLQKLFATNNSIKECFVLFQCWYNLLLFGLDSPQLMQKKNGKLFSCGSGGKAGHPPTGRSWLDPWFLQAVGESILGQDTEPWYSSEGSTA